MEAGVEGVRSIWAAYAEVCRVQDGEDPEGECAEGSEKDKQSAEPLCGRSGALGCLRVGGKKLCVTWNIFEQVVCCYSKYLTEAHERRDVRFAFAKFPLGNSLPRDREVRGELFLRHALLFSE